MKSSALAGLVVAGSALMPIFLVLFGLCYPNQTMPVLQ